MIVVVECMRVLCYSMMEDGICGVVLCRMVLMVGGRIVDGLVRSCIRL
jgi:hypothetical protein